MKSRVVTRNDEKAALIKRLSNSGASLMVFCEDAPPASISNERVDDETWLIHPPYEFEQMEKWLYLGNWHAIYPGNANYSPFNSFSAKPDEIYRRLRAAGVTLLIDSFHDDIEWHVIEET